LNKETRTKTYCNTSTLKKLKEKVNELFYDNSSFFTRIQKKQIMQFTSKYDIGRTNAVLDD